MKALTHYFRVATLLCAGWVSTLWTVAKVLDPVAYVANQGGGVTVFSARMFEQFDKIAVDKDLHGLVVTPDGHWLLTANRGSVDVSVIGTDARKEIKRTAVGRNAKFMRISPDGRRAFVIYEPSSEGESPDKNDRVVKDEKDENDEAPAETAIIGFNQWIVVNRIKTTRETETIKFSPDGELLLVANEGDNTVGVYELSALKQVRRVGVAPYGNQLRGIKTALNGKTYVATLEDSDNLLLLDAGFKPTKTVLTGQGPHGTAFDREGQYLWVAANRADQLRVFGARTLAQMTAIPVSKRCWHLSFAPGDRRLSFTCGRSNTVQVIGPQKCGVVDTL